MSDDEICDFFDDFDSVTLFEAEIMLAFLARRTPQGFAGAVAEMLDFRASERRIAEGAK